jgi:hypothetical protein
MPKASMNKNGPFMLSICEIRLAWQNCHMLPEAYPQRVNGGPSDDFGTRILRPYACHDLRPREWRPLAARCDLWKSGLHLVLTFSQGTGDDCAGETAFSKLGTMAAATTTVGNPVRMRPSGVTRKSTARICWPIAAGSREP